MKDMIRVGNCSGFYGDRISAMREQLQGGELDYLTGDYLAELTMLILGKDVLKDASTGYAKTFLRQAEDTLGLALDKGVKIVNNAGGLNPAGLVARLEQIVPGAKIAYITGDQRSIPGALTANAYLGAFGISRALTEGADVVITGRVTDASVIVGPAIAEFGWGYDDLDPLAGAVVAGHIIECGTQCCGGNFAGFKDLLAAGRLDKPIGFPIAEIRPDGSCVITKHDGTGGAVTIDTVTAQLVYEIGSHRYLGPDVTTRLDTVQLSRQGPDRIEVSGVTGERPPASLKVGINTIGGMRNSVEFVVTGLDIDEKVAWIRSQFQPQAEVVDWSLSTHPPLDADSEEAASALLRCTVQDADADVVGRRFAGAAVELALASIPGFHLTAPPGPASPFGVFSAEYADREPGGIGQSVVIGETRIDIADPTEFATDSSPTGYRPTPYPGVTDSLTRRAPLGSFVFARSGDKGGAANLGLWVANDGAACREDRITWLTKLITPRKIRELIPEAADLEVEVFTFPNIGAVNVMIHGLLGRGVAASTRFDPQAKGLGEYVRSRIVNIQEDLL